jgi:hypothetical protein
MDRHQEHDPRIERALADLEERMVAARRRERRATALCVFACVIAITGWTPLRGQAKKTVEERVSDLEKRTGGVQIEDGITKLTAPLQVFDSRGRLVAAIEPSESGGTFAIGGPEKGFATLGTGADGSGLVRLHGSNRKPSLSLGSAPGLEGRGLFVMDGSGNRAEATLTIGANNRPRLGIGDRESGGVLVTLGDGGSGVVSIRDQEGELGVVAGGTASVRMGVYALGARGAAGVSIYADKLGGNVRVNSPQGVPVAGLFSEEEGGGVVLTGPAGGNSVVDLGVRDGGGSVRVFSVGGSPTRAALEADDKTGGVTVFAGDGKPAGSLLSRPGGSGYFQLLYNGITMVDAGMNEDNVGVVRAGPSSQKTVGVLAVPYRLVGRK